MLILPLHQPLTRANFPLVTGLLVLMNIVVFALLQSQDGAAVASAEKYYFSSGLAKVEAPLAERFYAEHPDPRLTDALSRTPPQLHSRLRARWQQEDGQFRAQLALGDLFADRDAWSRWQPLAADFDRLRAASVTHRYALRADRVAPETLVTSMFLHGGFDHLIGNMLFLIALGLLVEGAVGGILFAMVYLLGGVAANATWLALNEQGALIGASGAVAALMGSFCVLWGVRKVRFFYWIGFVFNYVKGPALALLPLWLGWELLQWRLSDGDRVAYEAHFGGILAGALLALGVRSLNWQRNAFFEVSDPAATQPPDEDVARTLVGQMRLTEAETLLAAIEAREPGRWEVAALRYRCARLANRSTEAARRAAAALSLSVPRAGQVREQWALLQECVGAGSCIATAVWLDLLQRMIAIEAFDSADELIRQIEIDDVSREALPPLILRVAMRLEERGERLRAKHLLELLRTSFHGTNHAEKASFLLQETGLSD